MLTPDQIASRQFLVSLRGYDRDEVDRFLEQVADTVAALEQRIREVEADLAAESSHVPAVREPEPMSPATVEPASPQEAFKALGEETTRILVAAEESARAIKEKAEERAQQEVETARREARDEVESARRTASKVVADAERRRNQISEDVRSLESIRDRLADQLREVVRTTTGTMRALAPTSTEAPADQPLAVGDGRGSRPAPGPGGASDLAPATGVPADDVDVDVVEDLEAEELWETGSPDEEPAAEEPAAEEPAAEEPPTEEPAAEEPPTDEPPTPTHVFDAMEDGEQPEPAADDGPTDDTATDDAATDEADDEATDDAATDDEATDDADALTPAAATPGSRQLREQSLAAVRPGLLRKVKRALQDVQNEVLDSLRRAGDDPALEELLPSEDGLTVLGAVGEQFLGQAYEAGLTDGAELAGEALPGDAGDASRVPARSATFGAVLSHEVTAALRATLRAGIEAGETSTSLSERVGEVFRDLKGPVSEVTVDEHLSRTYGYGTLDAWQAMGRTAKEWVPGVAPRCPEEMRGQNADAGAVDLAGEFPTGQVVPPAHDGCDCTMVPR